MNPNSTIQPANEDEDEDVPYEFQDGTSKLSLYLLASFMLTFNISYIFSLKKIKKSCRHFCD